jgi:hypothetical protein
MTSAGFAGHKLKSDLAGISDHVWSLEEIVNLLK